METAEFVGSYTTGKRPNRQDKPQVFRENGSIYAFTRRLWDKEHCRLGGTISPYLMDEKHAIEIDTPFDFWLVEQILLGHKNPL